MDYYVVDAFTEKVFEGNPAGVCVLGQWLPDGQMQRIAFENNLSETAFVVKNGHAFDLRWFTPVTEVDLCGHATLATAFVVANFVEPGIKHIVFNTKSGKLEVDCLDNGMYELDFPAMDWRETALPEGLLDALGGMPPLEVYASRDIVLIYAMEDEVRELAPDFSKLAKIETNHGFLATSPARDYDFVTRAFFPKMGINEDPVCGSAHCTLAPFWAKRFKRDVLTARQVSQRGGTLYCRVAGKRVKIAGYAALYLKGTIEPF